MADKVEASRKGLGTVFSPKLPSRGAQTWIVRFPEADPGERHRIFLGFGDYITVQFNAWAARLHASDESKLVIDFSKF